MKTAEEILKSRVVFTDDELDIEIGQHANIIKAMEEYASQFKSQPPVALAEGLPSDEEISEIAIEKVKNGDYLGDNCFEGFELGMIGMRDIASQLLSKKDEELERLDKLAVELIKKNVKNDFENDAIEILKLKEAMQEFVDRCDKGEIRSKYTYTKFKELLQ